MLPGQRVITVDGEEGVLSRIIATHVTGPRSVTHPAVEYEVNVSGRLVSSGPIPAFGKPWWMTDEQRTAALARQPRPADG